MKIRLVEPGYEGTFSGDFGGVQFVDGVSVDHVSDFQARQFASLIRVECAEDGTDPGANAQYQAALHNSAPNVTFQTQAEVDAINGAATDVAPAVIVPATYTREQLEAVADKGGIAGLREIADPLGIKGTSVHKLINSILSRGVVPDAQFIEGVDQVILSQEEEAASIEASNKTEEVNEG